MMKPLKSDCEASGMKAPARLYKYRPIDTRTITALISDQLRFSDPTLFNDPMDTNPLIEVDLETGDLERLLVTMARRRHEDELRAAADRLKYQGQKTAEHIVRQALSRASAELRFSELRYLATDPDLPDVGPEAYRRSLRSLLKHEVLALHRQGIASFSIKNNCPLMWSHYGAEHQGICVGYIVPPEIRPNLLKVSYKSDRLVPASLVKRAVSGCEEAESELRKIVFGAKAPCWRYEQEWRMLGERGDQGSVLELADITFGIRCPDAVRHTLVSAFAQRERSIRFFEMREVGAGFELERASIDVEELIRHYPIRAKDIDDIAAMFSAVT